jgi:hypothetical protein
MSFDICIWAWSPVEIWMCVLQNRKTQRQSDFEWNKWVLIYVFGPGLQSRFESVSFRIGRLNARAILNETNEFWYLYLGFWTSLRRRGTFFLNPFFYFRHRCGLFLTQLRNSADYTVHGCKLCLKMHFTAHVLWWTQWELILSSLKGSNEGIFHLRQLLFWI